MNLQEMLQKRASLIEQHRKMLNDAKGKTFTKEEQEKFDKDFDAIDNEIKTLDNLIEKEQKVSGREKDLDEVAEKVYRPDPGTNADPSHKQQEILDDGGFKNVGEFMHCVKYGDKKGRMKDLTTTDLGVLMPPAFSTNILRINPESEIIAPRAFQIPAGSQPNAEFKIPYLQQGSEGALGGVELFWTAEGKTISDTSDPKIKDLGLKPAEVAGLSTINNETLMNWEAAGVFIETLLRMAFSSGRDYKFLRGNGTGVPLGLLNAPGAVIIARNTSGTIKLADTAGMLGRMLPDYPGFFWIANITVKPTLIQMADTSGRLIFISGDATKGIPDTLHGYPIRWTGKTPTIGTQGDLILCCLNPFYLIKNGAGPFVAISEHVKFTTNKTVFRIVSYVDGQPWVKDPLKLEDKSTTVSPYIILK